MNAIKVAQTLQNNFIRYLLTTFNLERGEPELAAEIQRKFKASGRLFRGPFLELNPPYIQGVSVHDLADEGVIRKEFCKLRDDITEPHERPLPPQRPLYKHQERAVRRVTSEQRNIVVASGTGSGKTECFLIPVLNDLFLNPAPGVRALLIYPMNALVNDQLLRLRNLLRGTNITFGRYTSELKEEESEGRKNSPDAPMNEIVSREVMRGNRGNEPRPPQILITNYAMLEYLLLRPADSPIFDSGLWRFLCLDEAHTYTGAQGIEVSMLLRRLKHRLRKEQGEMRCIATSATLTEDRTAAAEFASHLFGEDFAEDDVIFGETLNVTDTEQELSSAPPISVYFDERLMKLREKLSEFLSGENYKDANLLKETAETLESCGLVNRKQIEFAHKAASDGNVSRFLHQALKSNPHINSLRMMMKDEPLDLHIAAQRLFESEGENQRAEAVCNIVELGAMARESKDTVPLLPARYHLFARSPQGVWICINPDCSGRIVEGKGWSVPFLQKRERCPHCNSAVFELAVCRDCGQTFLQAFNREGILELEGRHQADNAGRCYFTWQPLVEESEPEEGEEIEATEVSQADNVEICLQCRCYRKNCLCQEDTRYASLYSVNDPQGNPRQKISTCPRCNRQKANEIVTTVHLRGNAPLAVLTEELYQFTPVSSDKKVRRSAGGGRKLLTFADSRQGAAKYASYLQATVKDTLHRHLMARAAQELNEGGSVPDVEDLARRCTELAEDYGLFGEQSGYATDAEKKRRRTQMKTQIAGEFFSRADPRHSLGALGIVGCDIHFLADTKPAELLCSRLGLSPEATMVATRTLLDTMRLEKAVLLPEGVSPKDEVFGRNTSTTYYQMTGSGNKYVKNWVGKSERQTRFDYVRRILEARGKSVDTASVQNALQAVWNWLREQYVFVGSLETGFQIDSARLIFPTKGEWYLCNGCFRLTRRLLAETLRICPSHGCKGELIGCDPQTRFSSNHYRYIFDRKPIAMRVEEHTAQLQPHLGREYQDKFIEGKINVLSCSTTFELGVDVGDLQTVVLNNVPPTVANYRQRAGRAGRRVSGTAFILTYAAPRPHDRVYFDEPQRIIAGEVAVPHISVENKIIAERHLNAILLGHFLRYLSKKGRESLLKSGDFFTPNMADGRHIDFLKPWRTEKSQEIFYLVNSFFEENPDTPSGEPKDCIERLVTKLEKCSKDFERWLSEYERLRDEYTRKSDSSGGKEHKDAERMRGRFISLRQRLLDEDLISFLCREGILPSYSFPIDVVSLRLPTNRPYGDKKEADKSLRLERDKKIAIVEYAPGAEIVADKQIWKSVGVIIKQELNTYEYRVCGTCRNFERSERGGIPIGSTCKICRDPRPAENHFYIDPDGFTTDLTAEVREAGLQVEGMANRSRSFLLAKGQGTEEEIKYRNQFSVFYSYKRDGELVTLNSGEDQDGFSICERCGIKNDPPRTRRRNNQTAATHKTPWGEVCSGTISQYHLGYAFKSDTLHLRFESPLIPSGDKLSFWRSLTYALLEGSSLALQIERRDLDGVVRPFPRDTIKSPEDNYSQEVVLFDSVPGGAGHVRRIADNLESVLSEALKVAQCPECEEETSCLNCLRNYGNQIYWEELKRGEVARFLDSVIGNVIS